MRRFLSTNPNKRVLATVCAVGCTRIYIIRARIVSKNSLVAVYTDYTGIDINTRDKIERLEQRCLIDVWCTNYYLVLTK